MKKNDKRNERIAKKRGLTVSQVEFLREARGLTDKDFDKIPDAKLRRAVKRMEYYDMPRAREAFVLLPQKNDQGLIPPQALPNALRQLDSSRARALAGPQVAGMPAGGAPPPAALMAVPRTAGLSPTHSGWVSLGPGNIGGRTRAVVIHPATPAVMWAASAGGGVWRTDNGGVSWQPVDDFLANLAITSLVIDPTNPKIVHAGTGEGFSNSDALRGAGIFRTTDGVNWQALPATSGANFQFVNRLAISKNGKILLAATRLGIFRSADADRLTWTPTLPEDIADVDFHPTQNTKAVAGGMKNGKAYFTTDGGQTWKEATHPGIWSSRVEVTYAVKNPNVVYASVNNRSGEVWRSNDGGKSYAQCDTRIAGGATANPLGDQGWYGNVIWAGDPTNENFVIVGGIDLWRSVDGGKTFTDISTWWDSRSAHADQHCIVAHPQFNGTTNKQVFFGNDGGVYKTNDISKAGNNAQPPRINGWIELINTYGVTQFFGGAGNPATGVIIGGTQDNGTICFTPAGGTENWRSIFGGDGGWCAADPTNPKIFYGEYVRLNIHRNTDGGTTDDTNGDRYISGQFFNNAKGDWDWKPIPFTIPDAKSGRALFIAPFILDPNEPNRILGGGLSLWRTNDARTPNTTTKGPAWAPIKPAAGSQISAIAVAQGNSNLIWVGHTEGQIFKSGDGTAVQPIWQQMDHTGANPLSPRRYCTRIAIHPANNKIVYVTFGGYNRGNVWKTTDGGLNWANIGNSLPEAPVRALAIHPRRGEFLYLGSEVGVFASEDAGVTWSPTNEGPTNCAVFDLFWMNETLVCATHGRGMFQIDLSSV